jgi:BatD DUF11 like domain
VSVLLVVMSLLVPQGDAPTVQTQVDHQELTVGDRVTVTVTVDHDAATSVEWPSPSKLGSFDVLDTKQLPSVTVQGRAHSATAFTITAFEVGDIDVPSMNIVVHNPSDTTSVTLATDPIPLRVVTVGVNDAKDIRDIKPPLQLPRNWLLLIVGGVAIIAVIAASAWLYRRYRRRPVQPVAHAEPVLPTRPAHELALEALDRLEAAELPKRGEIQRHYSEAAEIIRTYLERRFGIVAMEMVSADIIQELESCVDDATVNQFREFFREADLVKFAKSRPSLEACHSLLSAARDLVDVTKVLAEPVPSLPGEEDVPDLPDAASAAVTARPGSPMSQ